MTDASLTNGIAVGASHLVMAVLAAVFATVAVAATGSDPLKLHGNPAGWRIEYPGAWHLERSASPRCRRVVGQATVATFPMRSAVTGYRTRWSCGWAVKPPLDPGGGFAADGIAFRVTCLSRGLIGPLAPPVFPLTLAQLAPVDPSVPAQGAPRPLMRLILHRGFVFNVSVWIGDAASPADGQALEGVLASLRFVAPRIRGKHRCQAK